MLENSSIQIIGGTRSFAHVFVPMTLKKFYPEHFKFLPQINCWADDQKRIKDGVKVPERFACAGDNNSAWMSDADLQAWIDFNKELIRKI